MIDDLDKLTKLVDNLDECERKFLMGEMTLAKMSIEISTSLKGEVNDMLELVSEGAPLDEIIGEEMDERIASLNIFKRMIDEFITVSEKVRYLSR
jgi:hypothetical protein